MQKTLMRVVMVSVVVTGSLAGASGAKTSHDSMYRSVSPQHAQAAAAASWDSQMPVYDHQLLSPDSHSAQRHSAQHASPASAESKESLRKALAQLGALAEKNPLAVCVAGGTAVGAVTGAVAKSIPLLAYVAGGAAVGGFVYYNRDQVATTFHQLMLIREAMNQAQPSPEGVQQAPSALERTRSMRSGASEAVAFRVSLGALLKGYNGPRAPAPSR